MNKIEKINLTAAIILSGICSCAPKPNAVPKNEYGLPVVERNGTYRQIIKADSTHRMVPLSSLLHPVNTAFFYATADNFTHQVLYHHPQPYLRLEAANALKKVQDSLHTIGLDLKIFDSYRPYSVTRKMWEIVPDDRYAANPANGSGHNRGVAVDLTLIDSKTGRELNMPTAFDSFSDTSHQDFMNLPEAIIQNRRLLKKVMEQYGFIALDTEWWHFYLPNPKRYELLDLSFKQLRRAVK
ncbi:MAG: M15 family metallopeptidase [Chitinophagaceae bacterium]